MALFKCKMCGGNLEITSGMTVAECYYCGTTQTLPSSRDEGIQNLFNRANHLRLKCEFDKAEQLYDKILQLNNAEAEAHWGIVLCKYGIEYVEDPKTFKRIPTCHRTSYQAVTADADYLAAIEHADMTQKAVYEAEAKAIEEIQKNILSIVKNESPYDVFLCYKETDEDGKRTVDSAIANDIYHQLTQEGLKVFYAAITLEDKLGQEYEPYIFAALNSAKVMLVIGTKLQYFSAVWVKNEWSRFLQLMKADRSKLLIPCYRDMDAYELPEEFAHLQAQDMSKIGFINDVVRGIKKVVVKDEPKTTVIKETVVTSGNANVAPLLKRVFMFLEDEDWDSADEYCEKVLDIDPENAQAYLGKLMVSLEVTEIEELKECDEPFDDEINYRKIMRFGDAELKNILVGYIEHINARNELARLEAIYTRAKEAMQKATTQKEFLEASQIFASVCDYKDAVSQAEECRAKAELARLENIYSHAMAIKKSASTEAQYIKAAESYESIPEYKDSVDQAKLCREKAEIVRKDSIYMQADALMDGAAIANYEKAKELFQSIPEWKDSDDLVLSCERTIEELKAKAEADRLEAERKAEEERKERERQEELDRQEAKRKKKVTTIVSLIACVAVVVVAIWHLVIAPNNKYNEAIAMMEAKEYEAAIEAFTLLDGYKDSMVKIEECNTAILDKKYDDALALMNAEKYDEAIDAFSVLEGYKDSSTKIDECNKRIMDGKYSEAMAMISEENYGEAITLLQQLSGYKDSFDKIRECNEAIQNEKYIKAVALMEEEKYSEAYDIFITLKGYKDSSQMADSIYEDALKQKLYAAKVGEYIQFGTYEQDNIDNGTEPIEWLVLEKEDSQLLVISRYALDCQEYHKAYEGITWENCTLRNWLNNNFLNSAFSDVESSMIPTVKIPAHANPEYSTDPGKTTQDKVFLLSITEVNNYFETDTARRCKPTQYALSKGSSAINREDVYWWLRSPGINEYTAATVETGKVSEVGCFTHDSINAVRPAIWIELD